MFYIYLITNDLNGKRYVGKTHWTIEQRWKRHTVVAKYGKTSSRVHAAIRKYGSDAFSIRELDKAPDCDTADYREMFWIAALQTYRRETGYNLTYGGDGVPPTDETRQKMSESHKGVKLSPEHCAVLSKVRKGKKLSAEHIAKGAAARTGLKRTPEQRARMSAAQRGKKLSPEALARVRAANALEWARRRAVIKINLT